MNRLLAHLRQGSTTPAISTGHLPLPEHVRDQVHQAFDQVRAIGDGAVSTVYPALERVRPDFFGISLRGTAGAEYSVGDARLSGNEENAG